MALVRNFSKLGQVRNEITSYEETVPKSSK